MSRPNLGTVPFQKLSTPSSDAILYAQCRAFRYSVLAESDCIRVLTTLQRQSTAASRSVLNSLQVCAEVA
jgi:hypothetical protein